MPVKSITRKTARAGKSLNTDLYIGLLRQALPLPPQTEADNERLIGLLSALSEREEQDDLNAEEQAFAELLAIVIEDFEDRHYSLPAVAPDEVLRALMEDRGLQHKDLAAIVGNKGLTTEILAGRRKISKDVAKRLSESLRIPVTLLL
jgi:HTH-type transcriptional regulator/antitoxin HigA